MSRLIYGGLVAEKILKDIKDEIDEINRSIDFAPVLAVLQIGHRVDSDSYLRVQIKTAQKCGIGIQVFELPSNVTFKEISHQIIYLNNSKNIHAIIIQLPMISDNDIRVDDVVNLIDPNKDVDGLSISQTARLSNGDYRYWDQCHFLIHVPCAAAACLLLLQETEALHPGVQSLVVGRGKLVGIPIANLLLWSANATITVCHGDSKSLREVVQRAEVLVTGSGQANLIKGEWIQPGAVVIDCGVNPLPNSEKGICGDVEFEPAKDRAAWITPTPGGVGPLTVALLMRNTLNAAKKAHGIPTHSPLVKPTGVLLKQD